MNKGKSISCWFTRSGYNSYCLFYFKKGNVNEISKLSKNSKCGFFLNSLYRYYKHPRVNNNYLKETKNVLSLTLKDSGILENMRISEAFKYN
jgi:hypothetical protein